MLGNYKTYRISGINSRIEILDTRDGSIIPATGIPPHIEQQFRDKRPAHHIEFTHGIGGHLYAKFTPIQHQAASHRLPPHALGAPYSLQAAGSHWYLGHQRPTHHHHGAAGPSAHPQQPYHAPCPGLAYPTDFESDPVLSDFRSPKLHVIIIARDSRRGPSLGINITKGPYEGLFVKIAPHRSDYVPIDYTKNLYLQSHLHEGAKHCSTLYDQIKHLGSVKVSEMYVKKQEQALNNYNKAKENARRAKQHGKPPARPSYQW